MSSPVKEAKAVGLTDRELEILSKAWKCMKNTPEVDFQKLAEECNMTNTGSASNAWGRIKKKLFPDASSSSPAKASSAAAATAPKTPKTPRTRGTPRKRKTEDEGAEPGSFTPVNKRRVVDGAPATPGAADSTGPATPATLRGRKVKTPSKAVDDDETEDELAMTGLEDEKKVPKTPKTPKTPKRSPKQANKDSKDDSDNVKTEADADETETEEIEVAKVKNEEADAIVL